MTTRKHRNQSKVDPGTIDWAARENKARNNVIMRGFMLPLLLGVRESFQCLTFPASNWTWERELAAFFTSKKFEFHGVEKDAGVHADQVAVARYLREDNAHFITTDKPVTLRTLLNRTTQKYDVIYLDYMGAWAKSKIEDLAIIFERGILDPHGYLMITLALNSDFNSSLLPRVLEIGAGDHDIFVIDDAAEANSLGLRKPKPGVHQRAAGIPLQIRDLAKRFGYELEIFPPHIYYNIGPKGGLYPEVSLCFRRAT